MMQFEMDIAKSPVVSIVITTHNRVESAKISIQSVLSQTYPAVEIIVVEDGSDGAIKEWLDSENLCDVHYERHAVNLGLAAARNTGLFMANGEFVAFLDDDDQWLPEKLQRQIDIAESLGSVCQIIYCGTTTQTIDGKVVRLPNLKGPIFNAVMCGWTPPQSAVMFRTKSLREIGGFDENLTSGIDHDMWMQCAVAGYQADYVNEALVIVGTEEHSSRMTLNTEKRITGIKGFLTKWKPEIEKAIGSEGYRQFYRNYLSREYEKFGMFALQNGQRLLAIKNLFLAIRHNIKLPRLYYKFFLTLIGSQRLYKYLKQLYYGKVLGGEREMELSGIPGITSHSGQAKK